mmetsp:Transcript_27794/g.30740  ORF Transcript_27794/g.30740 Transcript_27794/m.30740 type:complete len:92 (-) Transcript_27794:86-361(-)
MASFFHLHLNIMRDVLRNPGSKFWLERSVRTFKLIGEHGFSFVFLMKWLLILCLSSLEKKLNRYYDYIRVVEQLCLLSYQSLLVEKVYSEI